MKTVAHMITVYTSIIISIILFSMFALTYFYKKILYWMQFQLNLQT